MPKNSTLTTTSHDTVELDDSFGFQPAFGLWDSRSYAAKLNDKPVANDFSFSSGKNSDRMNASRLHELVADSQ